MWSLSCWFSIAQVGFGDRFQCSGFSVQATALHSYLKLESRKRDNLKPLASPIGIWATICHRA